MWKIRNKKLFEGKDTFAWRVAINVILAFKDLYKEKHQTGIKIKRPPIFCPNWPICYFDRASQLDGDLCGVGVVLKHTNGTEYRMSLGCETGTNTKGELLALWSLIFYANEKHLSQLHVVGDSKLIIGWLSQHCSLYVINLEC